MSFSFGVVDILILSELTTKLVSKVQNAPTEFKVFEADLNLARCFFEQLKDQFETLRYRLLPSSFGASRGIPVVSTIVIGLQASVAELEKELRDEHRTNVRYVRSEYSPRAPIERMRI